MTTRPISPATMPSPDALLRRFEQALARRQPWESLWQDAYEFALPQRSTFGFAPGGSGLNIGRKGDRVYDGTAIDAAEQLATTLLSNLTPAWSQWFGLKPGPDLSPSQAAALAPVLEKAGQSIQSHIDRSNFVTEISQCYLDLVVGGTAALYVEEAPPGGFSALRFTAIPLSDVVLEEGAYGALDTGFRRLRLTLGQMQARYPLAPLPDAVLSRGTRNEESRFDVIEALTPNAQGQTEFIAVLAGDRTQILQTGLLTESPLIAFRWLKSPGELYGRSPVMKVLPDIKTANKVVELVLKNASIAVTGIWQAEDDGVLNPANIELKPGAIIPKATGSTGLTPLQMPGNFDISQLVLDDLRARIRNGLFADKLAPVESPRMTATEVLERSADMALLLGATFGRLQNELITPLIKRCHAVLRRRGEVPDLNIDGRNVQIDYRSPLALAQAQRNIQNTLSWIQTVAAMGPQAAAAVNLPEAARFLGASLGVPANLINANPSLTLLKENPDELSTPPPAPRRDAQAADAESGAAGSA